VAISFQKLEATAPDLVPLARKAQFSLSKHGIDGQRARVALCLDYSGSMRKSYNSGEVQALAERVLALSTQLDDDGEVDVFFFGTNAWYAGQITLGQHAGAIDRLREGRQYGTTNYAGAIDAVIQWMGTDPTPAYVVFLTDGAPTSRPAAEDSLRAASQKPAFWKFLSIGDEPIEFLQKLDDLSGRLIDNADYQPVGDLGAVKDAALFDLMLVEYSEWAGAAREVGILP
jgi:hypothetical protein